MGLLPTIHDDAPVLTKYDPNNPPDVRNLQFQQTFNKTYVLSGGNRREEHWSNGYYSVAWFDDDLNNRGHLFLYSNKAREAFKIKYLHAFTDPDPAVPFEYCGFKNPTYLDTSLSRAQIHEQHLPLALTHIPGTPNTCFDARKNLPFDKTAYAMFVKTLLDIEELITAATGEKWHVLKTDLKQALQTQFDNDL